jgi:SH3 domain protein
MSTLRLKSFYAVSVFFLSFYGIILIPAAMADIQYVSDLLIVSVKEDQDPNAPVIGYLRSAEAVDVLEETEELMRIETEDGIQGWVRKKFLVKDKPKAVIIMELEDKIALLEENIRTLRTGSDSEESLNKMGAYKQSIATLTVSLENEKKTSLALQENLKQVNGKYQELSNKYQELANKQKDVADNIKELAALKDENKTLKDKIAAPSTVNSIPMLSGNMKWFLIGSAVLLLGFIIGRSIRGKRSYRY